MAPCMGRLPRLLRFLPLLLAALGANRISRHMTQGGNVRRICGFGDSFLASSFELARAELQLPFSPGKVVYFGFGSNFLKNSH